VKGVRRVAGGCHHRGMPNDAKTPMRSFRISNDLYRAAMDKARSEDRSLSEVIRVALEAYLEETHSD
jgi:hypothetical protein